MSVDEIKARWAAATPGPWNADSDFTGGRDVWGRSGSLVVAECIASDEDQVAIAAAPADIAYLLAALDTERARADRAEASHATLREVAHVLGICHCWDYGCEPGDRDSLVQRVKELTAYENERHELPGLTAALNEARWERDVARGEQPAHSQALAEIDRLRAEVERLRGELCDWSDWAGYYSRAETDDQGHRDILSVPLNDASRLRADLARVEKERDEAREKQRELHRRAQEVEGVAYRRARRDVLAAIFTARIDSEIVDRNARFLELEAKLDTAESTLSRIRAAAEWVVATWGQGPDNFERAVAIKHLRAALRDEEVGDGDE